MIIEIKNSLAELAGLHRAAEAFLGETGVDDKTRFAVLLALEEVVSNIIRHAYDDALPHVIRVDFCCTPQAIEVEVADDGRAFDPSAQPPVDIDLPPEHRPVGGLGIFLTREIVQEMHYRRENGINRLRLRFSHEPALTRIVP